MVGMIKFFLIIDERIRWIFLSRIEIVIENSFNKPAYPCLSPLFINNIVLNSRAKILFLFQ